MSRMGVLSLMSLMICFYLHSGLHVVFWDGRSLSGSP